VAIYKVESQKRSRAGEVENQFSSFEMGRVSKRRKCAIKSSRGCKMHTKKEIPFQRLLGESKVDAMATSAWCLVRGPWVRVLVLLRARICTRPERAAAGAGALFNSAYGRG
jgi:hypothetical protein